MRFLRHFIAAVLRQKREYIPRQEDTADHRAKHTKENHSDQRRLNYARRCIFARSNCQQPFPVEYMVREKQDEHPHSQPLMRRLAHKTVCHQKQQRRGHRGIDRELLFPLQLHPYLFYSPSPAAHSRTELLDAPEEKR